MHESQMLYRGCGKDLYFLYILKLRLECCKYFPNDGTNMQSLVFSASREKECMESTYLSCISA